MAISPISDSKKTKNRKNKLSLQQKQLPNKRTKAPGIRVVGSRIYDSENGKSCHQCRQKTMDFTASCKNETSKNKACTIKFCHKCLLNRYGENAEDVAKLEDWKCPKCRGICNCSLCMKKKGHQPTGILAHTAKATGFSSVFEMLHVTGPEGAEMIVKDLRASPRKPIVSDKGPEAVSKKKSGKGSIPTEQGDPNVQCKRSLVDGDVRLDAKRVGRKKLRLDRSSGDVRTGSGDDGCLKKEDLQTRVFDKDSLKIPKKEQTMDGINAAFPACDEPNVPIGVNINDAEAKPLHNSKFGKLRKHVVKRSNDENADKDVVLPQGNDLLTVAGIELPADDVGPALQFLKFCNAFGQVLDLKKDQPELVLREVTCGRVGRRGLKSSIVQFHIKLLSLIQKDIREDGCSWLQALGKCISESQCTPKELPLDFINRGNDGYDKLDSSKKLRLLTFICDETLGTEKLRNWIEEENLKFIQRKKEAKENILAAKEKEKRMKQELKDEMAKVILASRNGAPLSISEHESLLSKIRTASEKAHAEKLHAMDMVPKRKQRADAVRTEPIFLDGSGRIYWRLRGDSYKSNIILQDIGNLDLVTTQDKWFIFDDQQEKDIEKYFSSLRKKQQKACTVFDKLTLGSSEASLTSPSDPSS